MSKPVVGIVVLNWNHLELTKKCLESISAQSYTSAVTIVIDNGSTDGSKEWLDSQKPQAIQIISNPVNIGFAPAINQGIQAAIDLGCTYVVSLNNDATLDPDWLKELVTYMDAHPECGFAQGASMQSDHPELFDSTGVYLERGFIPNQRALGSESPKLDMPVIGPNAAGAMYRARMLRDVSQKKGEYFDGRFFAYVEDVDLALRCTARGYQFGFVPKAKLYHMGSQTGNRVAKKKMFWGARNMVWLVYKNAPTSVIRRTIKMILRSHIANLQFLWREQRPNFLPYLRGLVVGLVGLPSFSSLRRANLQATKLSDDAFYNLLVPSNPPVHNPLRKLRLVK